MSRFKKPNCREEPFSSSTFHPVFPDDERPTEPGTLKEALVLSSSDGWGPREGSRTYINDILEPAVKKVSLNKSQKQRPK